MPVRADVGVQPDGVSAADGGGVTWIPVRVLGKLVFRYEPEARLIEIKVLGSLHYVDLKQYDRAPIDKTGQSKYTRP